VGAVGLKTDESSETGRGWWKGQAVGGGGAFAGQTETVAAKFTLAFVCFVFGLLNELSSLPQSMYRRTTG
jgi:hypothetical protein